MRSVGTDVALVVTDLDGTLWDRSLVVHPSSRRAIDRLLDAGVHVLAATARRPATIRRAFETNELMLPAVCHDGALGRILATGETFWSSGFDPAIASAVLVGLSELGLEPAVSIAVAGEVDCLVGPMPSTHPDHVTSIQQWIRPTDDLAAAIAQHTVLVFSFCGLTHDLVDSCRGVMPPGVTVTGGPDVQYGGFSLTVRPPGIDKWAGVTAYCALHGLDPDRTLAVGDGHNDRELLASAGTSCAVTGGDPQLLATADHVIGRPSEGGWSAIADLVLG